MGDVIRIGFGFEREPWMSKRELAAHLGLSTRTITRMMRQGMPHLKPYEHGSVRFRRTECERWFRGWRTR